MKDSKQLFCKIRRSNIVRAALFLVVCIDLSQAGAFPVGSSHWPTFPRRNIAALARDGYLRGSPPNTYKRSISTLAKNGQLPTFRSPYDENDKQEQDDDDSHEKRNIASIARLRSYVAAKRNVQALAREGYKGSRTQYSHNFDKRNIAALARNGMIHKKNEMQENEYFYPFYQNSIPQHTEIDGPFDNDDMYDFQQSVNPDMFPAMSQVFKRNSPDLTQDLYYPAQYDDIDDDGSYFKRGASGLPTLGVYRPTYLEPGQRSKRYILSLPDVIDHNNVDQQAVDNNDDTVDENKRSVDDDSDGRVSFEKRHIGSLARLGLLPSFRFTGGRYSRSGRARLLWPNQELYRKHTPDKDFRIREYITSAEAQPAIDSDDSYLPSAPVSSHSHPTGRILYRSLNNDLPYNPPAHPHLPTNNIDPFTKNLWHSKSKETPKFYYFRSLKIPYHNSGKRYLLLPAVDNILLRKNYPNSSLPSRRKNQ